MSQFPGSSRAPRRAWQRLAVLCGTALGWVMGAQAQIALPPHFPATVEPRTPNTTAAPEVALAQGILYDEVLRDPQEAAASFRQVLGSESALPAQRQEATWRLARCLRRLNRPDAARPLLQSLLRDESLPPEVRRRAEAELAAAPLVAPARLMPADTLVYLEIPRPGRTVAQWSGVLQRAGLDEQVRRFVALALQEQDAPEVGALLNRSMQEELDRIEGVAIGWHNFRIEQAEGRRALVSDVLLVLYTGQSVVATSLFRSVIARLELQTTVEGVGFFARGGRKREFLYTSDEGLFIGCTDPRAGTDARQRHAGQRRGPTLYGSAAFKLRPVSGQPTGDPYLFVNVPPLLDLVTRLQPDERRGEFEALLDLLSVRAVGPLLATLRVTDDRLELDAGVQISGTRGLLLRLWRSPPLDPGWASWIPETAALGVVSSLTPADRRWLDLERFMDQAAQVFGEAPPPRTAQEPLAIARLLERASGIRIADDLLISVRGAALVWLAGVGDDGVEGFPPFVLNIDVDDPAAWMRRFELGLRQFLYGQVTDAALPKVVLDTPAGRIESVSVLTAGVAWHVRGRRICLSTSAAAIERYLSAPAPGGLPTDFAGASKLASLRLDVLLARYLGNPGLAESAPGLPPLQVATLEDDDEMRIHAVQRRASGLVRVVGLLWAAEEQAGTP